MAKKIEELTLHQKVEILFAYGKMWGLETDETEIAKTTGLSSYNIKKIRLGSNDNPGLKTLKALADHFGLNLAYFDNKTRDECWDYLNRRREGLPLQEAAQVAAALRSDLNLSEKDRSEVVQALKAILKIVRRSEENSGK